MTRRGGLLRFGPVAVAGHCHCATAMRGQSVSGSAITTCRRFDCVFEKEYASRHIFLGVAGKKARQGARVSGYDCALSVFYETQHTPLLSVTCCRVSTVTRYKMCKFRTRSRRGHSSEYLGYDARDKGSGAVRSCSPPSRHEDWTIATDAGLHGILTRCPCGRQPVTVWGVRHGLLGPGVCPCRACRERGGVRGVERLLTARYARRQEGPDE